MDHRVSPEFILAAIGDVGASGLHFLLRSPPEKISGGELRAVGTRDSHEHVPILVVHVVSYGILTERVTDLTIDAPGFPGYESPSTDERIRRPHLSLLGQCPRSLPCPAIERSTTGFHCPCPYVHRIGLHALMMTDGAISRQGTGA